MLDTTIPTELEAVQDAAPQTDFELAKQAVMDVPMATGDLEAKEAQFYTACEYIRSRAPVTADELELLFNEDSVYTGGLLLTVQAAFEHLQRRRDAESDAHVTGRPVRDTSVDRADEQASRKLARQAKQEAKAQHASEYAAYLARCAHRRQTIAQARNTLEQSLAQRKIAFDSMVQDFNTQWDAYITGLRIEARRLESIPAAQWSDEVIAQQTTVAIS